MVISQISLNKDTNREKSFKFINKIYDLISHLYYDPNVLLNTSIVKRHDAVALKAGFHWNIWKIIIIHSVFVGNAYSHNQDFSRNCKAVRYISWRYFKDVHLLDNTILVTMFCSYIDTRHIKVLMKWSVKITRILAISLVQKLLYPMADWFTETTIFITSSIY